ncbi:MAG: hypothetical protein JXQ73_03725 [Phycisphaerae bacterium]|nr:hypothetical protein [Phycisphaerae bacterium]
MRFAVLVAGYGFIFVSYAWVWIIASGFSQDFPMEKIGYVTKKDVTTVLTVMGLWTVLWLVVQTVEGWS